MIKRALTFAIDFDGVLTNDRRWLISALAKHFGVGFNTVTKKMDIDYMNITKEMSKDFWYSHSEEFESLPIEADAIEGIKRLHYFGHKAHCVTARGVFLSEDYQELMQRSTRMRINAAHIPFDSVIFTNQKGEVLRNVIHHDVIIDDDPSHFDGPPITRPLDQDWGGQDHPVEICFGYEAPNAHWTGNRISSFYELETIYPGIYNTSFEGSSFYVV